jgi:ribose 5-phosphate isomerase B
MRIAFACDHAGFLLKKDLTQVIEAAGHEVLDFGTFDTAPVDYPDYVQKAGQALQKGQADRAIVVCGSGIGASIAANKMKGVYAALSHDTYSAHQGVEHDNANMLCMGSRVVGVELAKEIAKTFLSASFLDDERFVRRFQKIQAMEVQA